MSIIIAEPERVVSLEESLEGLSRGKKSGWGGCDWVGCPNLASGPIGAFTVLRRAGTVAKPGAGRPVPAAFGQQLGPGFV